MAERCESASVDAPSFHSPEKRGLEEKWHSSDPKSNREAVAITPQYPQHSWGEGAGLACAEPAQRATQSVGFGFAFLIRADYTN